MKLQKRYSVILGNLGNTCDRFLSSGYREALDKDVILDQAASIEEVRGIELVGTWDDDMIVGSVRLVEYFEMLYWLEKTGYAGWYSMDQYPYREDGCGAVRSSVLFLQRLQKILDRVGVSTVDTLIRKRDPVATATFIRDHLIAPV